MGAEKFRPADPDAEAAIVGALLISPDLLDDVTVGLHADDFGDRALGEVFRAIVAVDAAGRAVDTITVADELRRAKSLGKVGGPDRLAELVDTAVATPNVAAYVDIVTGKAKLRRVIEAGRAMATAAVAPDADPDDVRETAEALVFDLGKERTSSSMVGMPEALAAFDAEMRAARTGQLLGLSTGFPDLDALTGGAQGGQLWIVAARPAMGKSALALQLARTFAEQSGCVVPVISYEMTAGELTVRLVSQATGIPGNDLRAGLLPPGADRDLAAAVEELAQVPLLLDGNPPRTISALRSAMRRLARRQPLGAIVVDYLQLMESDRQRRDGTRNDEVSDISRGLKRLAAELDVVCVALSQLSRALEMRQDKRPILSDLRESGSLEQDANCVLFVHREIVFSANADPRLAEVIVAKNRGGACGTVHCEWLAPATRFVPTKRRPQGGTTLPGPQRGQRGGGYGSRDERPF